MVGSHILPVTDVWQCINTIDEDDTRYYQNIHKGYCQKATALNKIGPFYWHGLTLIHALISDYMRREVFHEIN